MSETTAASRSEGLGVSMAERMVVQVVLDPSSAEAVGLLLEEVALLLPKYPEQVRQLFLDRVDACFQVVRLNGDGVSAPAAGELRVGFEPTDGFGRFVSALRAGDVEAVVVEVDQGALLW